MLINVESWGVGEQFTRIEEQIYEIHIKLSFIMANFKLTWSVPLEKSAMKVGVR